jgi:hypothetical protein
LDHEIHFPSIELDATNASHKGWLPWENSREGFHHLECLLSETITSDLFIASILQDLIRGIFVQLDLTEIGLAVYLLLITTRQVVIEEGFFRTFASRRVLSIAVARRTLHFFITIRAFPRTDSDASLQFFFIDFLSRAFAPTLTIRGQIETILAIDTFLNIVLDDELHAFV